jgi:hypothetical protein
MNGQFNEIILNLTTWLKDGSNNGKMVAQM